jgi:hypothetical protein
MTRALAEKVSKSTAGGRIAPPPCSSIARPSWLS